MSNALLQVGSQGCSQDPGGPGPGKGFNGKAGASIHSVTHLTGSQLWGRILSTRPYLCTQQGGQRAGLSMGSGEGSWLFPLFLALPRLRRGSSKAPKGLIMTGLCKRGGGGRQWILQNCSGIFQNAFSGPDMGFLC